MSIVVRAIVLCALIIMVYNTSECIKFFSINNDIITRFGKKETIRLYVVYVISILMCIGDVVAIITCDDNIWIGLSAIISSLFFTVIYKWLFSVVSGVKKRANEISETLIGLIEACDTNLDGHSLLVMDLVMLIYDYMPVEYKRKIQPENLRYAALFLDIGKLGVPGKVLNKPAKLEDEEWSLMKRHPEIAVKVLGNMESFKEISDWIVYHHERIDGKGYYKLRGEEIPLASRIIAVADTYAAIVMVRSYKPSRSYDDAISTLKVSAGTQLDEEIVEIFLSVPREKVESATREVINKMKLYSEEKFRDE
ncbi:MAG: HD domain-containing protein [Lachnospiraceae bacterium]|jgi:HD-GYP domain-containing protein (c-di-GMP phosphodiesterase class II)|nr:HD domain-containing protein [Lachnospiraceae bacterium]